MKNINLTEEEIQVIRIFLSNVERIDIIQCVYILSYFSKEKNMDIIEIVSIVNYSKRLLENQEGIYNESTEYLYNRVNNLVKENTSDRLVFTTDTSLNYSIFNLNNLNINSEKKLLSSTILLDYFNRFQRNKEIVGEELEPYSKVNTIDNIDEIFNTKYVKKLRKTI